jgi:hypothetical protein
VEDAVHSIQHGDKAFGWITSEVDDPVFDDAGLGGQADVGGRNKVDADHAASRAAAGQQADNALANEPRSSGDDYRAHRPTMPL